MKIVNLPFSKRFEKAMHEGRIALSLSQTIRGRIWQLLLEYNDNFLYQPNPLDNWNDETNASEQCLNDLKKLYGTSLLQYQMYGVLHKDKLISEQYISYCPDSHVFDIIQFWYIYISGSERQHLFQLSLNEILDQEKAGWIFVDGHFFKLDSEFLVESVLNKANELLMIDGYDGPLQEFVKAREYLDSGEYREAISCANNAFESTLKVILIFDSAILEPLQFQLSIKSKRA